MDHNLNDLIKLSRYHIGIKPGQVWVNKGFEATYGTRFFCSVVRVCDVTPTFQVIARSLADNKYGEFGFGGPTDEHFTLRYIDFLDRFRKFEPEDLHKFKQSRKVYRILYAQND